MTRLNEHQRIWRTAVLVLLAVSFIGPWGGEEIHVPAEYDCSPPYLRVEGDYCAMMGFWAMTSHAFGVAESLITETTTFPNLSLAFLLLGSFLLFTLPFYTTPLLMLLAPEVKGLHRVHILIWSLAVAVLLILALHSRSSIPSSMWGLWLYIRLAPIALALELASFITDRRSALARVSAGYRV